MLKQKKCLWWSPLIADEESFVLYNVVIWLATARKPHRHEIGPSIVIYEQRLQCSIHVCSQDYAEISSTFPRFWYLEFLWEPLVRNWLLYPETIFWSRFNSII